MDAIFNWNQSLEENYYQILGCDQSSTVSQIVVIFWTLSFWTNLPLLVLTNQLVADHTIKGDACVTF